MHGVVDAIDFAAQFGKRRRRGSRVHFIKFLWALGPKANGGDLDRVRASQKQRKH
jgi:hypothetical protein